MSIQYNRMALLEAVELMFARNQRSHPDSDIDGAEKSVDAAKIHEFTNLEDALKHTPEISTDVKPRVVILSTATKLSGNNSIYNVHKGRQNPDKGVQIGRTWRLETLTSIDCPAENPYLLVVGFQKLYFWVFASPELRDRFAGVLKETHAQFTGREVKSALTRPQQPRKVQTGPAVQVPGVQSPIMHQVQGVQSPGIHPQGPGMHPHPGMQYPGPQSPGMQPQMPGMQYPGPQSPGMQPQMHGMPNNSPYGSLPVSRTRPQRERTQVNRMPSQEYQAPVAPPHASPAVAPLRNVKQHPSNSQLPQTPIDEKPQIPTRAPTRSHRASSTNQRSLPQFESQAPAVLDDDDELNFSNIQETIPEPQKQHSSTPEPAVPPRVDHHLNVERKMSLERQSSQRRTQRTLDRKNSERIVSGSEPMPEPPAHTLEPSPSFQVRNLRDEDDNEKHLSVSSVTSPLKSPPQASNVGKNAITSPLGVPGTQQNTHIGATPPSLRPNLAAGSSSGAVGTPSGGGSIAKEPIRDLNSVIEEFQWNGESVEELEKQIKNKLDVLANQNFASVVNLDDQLGDFDRMVQKSIQECDSVDSKIQAVAMNLAGRKGEVSDIEGREDGLQVVSLNYRKLATEIEKLLEVSRLDDGFVAELSRFQFPSELATDAVSVRDEVAQLSHLEGLLLDLNQALEMFSHRSQTKESTMMALQEPKRTAEELASSFGTRLVEFLGVQFRTALKNPKTVDSVLFKQFYVFSGCVLFTRDTSPKQLHRLVREYQTVVSGLYTQYFSTSLSRWTSEVQDLVAKERTTPIRIPAFHHVTDDNEGDSANTNSVDAGSQREKRVALPLPIQQKLYELLHTVVDDVCVRVSTQQRFVEKFFHIGSDEMRRFPAYIAQENVLTQRRAVGERTLTAMELQLHPGVDANSTSAPAVQHIMQQLFPGLLELLVRHTAVSSVGLETAYLLLVLDIRANELRSTNQQFLADMLASLLRSRSESWEEESRQHARNILSVRFKTKKRVGVHPVVAWFTEIIRTIEFAMSAGLEHEKMRRRRRRQAAIELLPATSSGLGAEDEYEGDTARTLVDRCHENMFRAIAQGLRMGAAATELQTSQGAAARLKAAATNSNSAEETKELLNRHVVMIENLYRIFTDLGQFGSVGVRRIVADATKHYKSELSSYITDVIVRPLGKIVSFLSQYDAQPGMKQKEVHSQLKRACKGMDRKEIRAGVDNLRKRVEKHFTGSDPAVFSNVWRAIGEEYTNIHNRLVKISQSVDGTGVVDFKESDFKSMF